jgi:hypothetical protein
VENYKLTNFTGVVTAYLVERMGDVGGKCTIIDPCQHKAVRISVSQALLHHASVLVVLQR